MRMMLAKMFCRKMARQDKKAEEGAEPARGVICTENVPFYRDLTADVYSPCGGHDLPAVLDVHGGGLMYGDKRLNRRFCAALASCGFTVVSADYRLFPEASFRDAAEDVARAAEFTARVYGKNGFYLAGDSAGAELALTADGAAASEKVRAAFGIDGKLAPPSDGLFLICGAFAFGKSVATALMGIKAGKGDYMKYTSADALSASIFPAEYTFRAAKATFCGEKRLKCTNFSLREMCPSRLTMCRPAALWAGALSVTSFPSATPNGAKAISSSAAPRAFCMAFRTKAANSAAKS